MGRTDGVLNEHGLSRAENGSPSGYFTQTFGRAVSSAPAFPTSSCRRAVIILSFLLLSFSQAALSQTRFYLGMDRNDYPGDANMELMKPTFAFTGYWLNVPPGAGHNSWTGKRLALEAMGYGFLLLFNGREYDAIKASGDPAALAVRDASAAVQSATREGFPRNAVLFLDQEQGGRMLPEQRAYIHAWADAVVKAGYRAGIYCSGVAFKESKSTSVITANDIRDHAGGRDLQFFIANDQCGPSPGCVFPKSGLDPSQSGLAFARVWQYAQSPRRPEVTAACRATYAADGNCYPPGVAPSLGLHIDADTSDSPDPSHARSR